MKKPIVGITMGDAAGIGPEIIVKALADRSIYEACRPMVIGDAKILIQMVELLQLNLSVHPIQLIGQANFEFGTIDCLDLDLLPLEIQFGKLSGLAGNASFHYLKEAILLANSGLIDAICTAPLNKEALHMAGHHFPGHTEILAHFTGTDNYGMMFSTPKLKVILVTVHLGLIDAVQSIDSEKVYNTILLARQTLKQMGVAYPRIAVCGINPHAGEGGLFGYQEEERIIVPAIDRALKGGINASGPYPADTIFFQSCSRRFRHRGCHVP